MHFMVTQGLRDKTLRVNYPMANKKLPAGETNPAAQQIDFYIRSPQQNPKNRPNRQVFLHFFGMEITWKQARRSTRRPARAPYRLPLRPIGAVRCGGNPRTLRRLTGYTRITNNSHCFSRRMLDSRRIPTQEGSLSCSRICPPRVVCWASSACQPQ
jgi:hypothetical protein